MENWLPAWANDGRTVHDVRADDGSWRSPILAPGDTVERTFTEPGVYAFFCSFHGSPGAGMVGTVLVGGLELPGDSLAGGLGRGRVPGGARVNGPGRWPGGGRQWDRR